MVIYIIHILVGNLMSKYIVIDWIGYGWVKLLLVIGLSIMIAAVFDMFMKRKRA